MIIEPDPVCGSGGSSVWRYMAALPHLSLIECKLNLVLSLGGKTETEGEVEGRGGGDGQQSIWKQYLQNKNHIRRAPRSSLARRGQHAAGYNQRLIAALKK